MNLLTVVIFMIIKVFDKDRDELGMELKNEVKWYDFACEHKDDLVFKYKLIWLIDFPMFLI